jgi:hypothetical protein
VPGVRQDRSQFAAHQSRTENADTHRLLPHLDNTPGLTPMRRDVPATSAVRASLFSEWEQNLPTHPRLATWETSLRGVLEES